MTAAETAEMLGIGLSTLRERWRDYGIEKCTALGHNEPRFYRSQVIQAMHLEGKVLRGHATREKQTRAKLAERITPFPRRTAPTLAKSEAAG